MVHSPNPSRWKYFWRGILLVAALERATHYPAQDVMAFVAVIGTFLWMHRVLLAAARKRLERAARARWDRYPAPGLLLLVRAGAIAGIIAIADVRQTLAAAIISAFLLVTMTEILLLRLALRRAGLAVA